MGNQLRRLFWRILLLLTSPIIWSLLSAAFQTVTSNFRLPELVLLLVSSLLYWVFFAATEHRDGRLHYNLLFFMVFRHELSHALTAFSFGNYLDEMHVLNPQNVSGTVGQMRHHRARGLISLIITPFITLAPYYLPTFTIPLLLLKVFPLHAFDILINALIGFSLGFHFRSVAYDLRSHQDDIKRVGHTVAIALILSLNIVFFVLIYSAGRTPLNRGGIRT